jgi:hypothetical protein
MTDQTSSLDQTDDEYPIQEYAARLRELLGRGDDVTVTFDDLNAGPLAFAHVGDLLVVYGGDAADEGMIGVSIWDAEYEPVKGFGDDYGFIEADTWSEVQTQLRAALVQLGR